MNRYAVLVVAVAAVFCLAAAAPARFATSPFDWGLPEGVAPPPVPIDNPMTAAKVELGRRLFYDANLSVTGSLSCASCHEQAKGFAVGDRTRPGVHGGPGRRNPMGLANVGYFTPLTWADSTAKTLETQVATPLFGDHPVEMGMATDGGQIVRHLSQDACYRRLFAAAFPETPGAVSMTEVSKALAAFQRTLISWHAPYDRTQRGEPGGMSAQAKAGEKRFGELLCTQCHAGSNFTDGEFHQTVEPLGADEGLIEKTGEGHHRGYFRTPSLRNVALTGPYLHDGRAATLHDAIVDHPAELNLTPADFAVLEAFLNSLTDPVFTADPRFGPPSIDCAPPG